MTNTIGATPKERELIEGLRAPVKRSGTYLRMEDGSIRDPLMLDAATLLESLISDRAKYREALTRQNDEICQTLGKVLGYPWFKDDQKNFPGATEENGVCVGDHVAESIAEEAAKALVDRAKLREALEALPGMLPPASDVPQDYLEGWVDAMVYAQHCLQPATTKGQSK